MKIAMQFTLLSLPYFSRMILFPMFFHLHNGILIPTASSLRWIQIPFAQILLLIKLIQKSLHVMTSPATILNYFRIQRELFNRLILLQRELLKTP
jgi:hypothetical protein